MTNPLQGIIVCAVSRPEQAADDKVSMEQQERDGRAFFEREQIELLDVLRIDGYSRDFYTLREFVEYASRKGNLDAARLEHYLHNGGFNVMWVRATNRIAREQSINAEIIGRAVKECKAQIYSQLDGWINKTNRRGVAAITGFRDSSEIDDFRKKRADGIAGRLREGVPVTGKVPFSHRLVRTGKKPKDVKVVPRRNLAPLWRDLVTLMLEGVAYGSLEDELFKRFNRGQDGKPYTLYKFFNLLYTPAFWGNNVLRWKEFIGSWASGEWVFDPSVPAPEGVDIIYGAHEPAISGELAQVLIAEIRRRRERYNGNERIYGAKPLTGIVVCNRCRAHYCYNIAKNKPHLDYMFCGRKGRKMVSEVCDNGIVLHERDVIAFLDARLREWVAIGDVTFAPIPPHAPDSERRQAEAEIKALKKRMNSLTEELIEADNELKAHFRQQLRTTKNDLVNAENRLADIETLLLGQQAIQQRRDFTREHIRTIGVDAFWQSDPIDINRHLLAFLGEHRLIADNGEIIGYDHKPYRPRRRGNPPKNHTA